MRRLPFILRALIRPRGLLAMLCLSLSFEPALAANYLYQIRGTASTNIWRIDPLLPGETQVVTAYPGGSSATLAQCPNGLIYYAINATNGAVYRWDPATPTIPPVALGTLGAGIPGAFRMACSPAGTLYYLPNSGTLYTLSLTTGAATATGATITGLGSGGDMAFDTAGTLYVVNSSRQLFTAPIGGGAATSLGTISGFANASLGLAFNSAGTLFVQGQDPSQLYSVNLGTLAATPVIALSGGTSATGDLGSTAFASPTVAKSFAPASIAVNDTSVLTITLSNTNATALTGAALTDTYPAGLVNTVTPGAASTCGGTVTALPGGGSVALSGGTIPASGSCTVTVNVTSASAANYVNTIPTRGLTTTTGYNDAPASATLTVLNRPTIAKAFAPGTILTNAISTITFTLSNTNASALTGMNFTDAYPAGLANATPLNVGGTCAGVTHTATAGGNSFNVTGGTIPASGSCTITVEVTSSAVGSYNNTTSGVTTAQTGSAGPASNTATLQVVSALPPEIAKSFTPATIQNGGTSVLTLTISNPSPATTLTGVAVSDTYPAGLVNRTASPAANPAVSCTAGSSGSFTGGANGGNTIGFTGGTIIAGGSCTVTVNVTSTTDATYNNTTGAVTSTNGGTGGTASATLIVQAGRVAPVISKAFSPSTIAVNGVSTLTFTITNPNNQTLFNVAFNDIYPAGLVNAATPNVSSNCDNVAGGTAGTTGGVAGGNTIGLDGTPGGGGSPNDMPANSTCAVTVQVTSATPGTHNNVSGNVTGRSGNGAAAALLTGNTAAANLVVLNPPTITKNFAPDPITVNGVSVLTITLTNPNAGTALTGAAFTDTYPAPITNSSSPAGATTCAGGTVTAASSGPSVALSGGTIPAGGSCTVTVNVTSSTPGAHVNNIAAGGLTTTNAGSNTVAATDALTVVLPLTIVKNSQAFSDPINNTTNPKRIPGSFSNYTLDVQNSSLITMDNNSIVITDPIPANTDLFVSDLGAPGSGPVSFVNGVPSSGLTYTFTSLASAGDDVSFSNDNGATYTYTPTPNANGVDPAVTHIRINPKGSFNSASSFSVTLRVRVE